MAEGKIVAVRDCAVSKSVSELRPFLGLANYYRRFVEGFSKRASLLTELLKKDVQWSWDLECQVTFDGLKQAMMEVPLLGIADVTKPFKVETYASYYALGKRSSNQAIDALSWKQEHAVICLLAHLQESEIGGPVRDTLREFPQKDHAAQNVMNLAKDKVEKVKVVGLLDPLLISTRPWESVSMDFITHLPKVGDFEAILVIIDRFSKYATFISTTKQCSVEMTAQLFFKHVVKLWGVPTSITERFNCMLEEYLRHFVNARQKNWVQLLDVAQFCFNAQTSSSTGRSPFEIVSSKQPVLPYLINHPYVGKNPQALNFTNKWKQTNDIARAYLEKASRRMKK
ncbi:reverse transcriptase [Cucumis melo var. makuwa]|uniref:Reverse transcriptase n=1 Tax=Cucumis melo var. makuwa TaxID=1194695 RepID=A0A5D3CSE4_CUCMM|nr:reverse transcriptase [Cucumis melo var. makuwa]TYK14741.1 reverse transcriptase [Cucumis melo var. makuwa]